MKRKVKHHSGSESGEASAKSGSDPMSLTDWIKQQDQIFGHLHKLPANWIRMRSQSKGTVFFYNIKSGVSARLEPAADVASEDRMPRSTTDRPPQQTETTKRRRQAGDDVHAQMVEGHDTGGATGAAGET